MGAGIIINIDRIIINTDNRPVTKLYKNSYIKKEKPIEKQTKGIHVSVGHLYIFFGEMSI